MNRRSMLGAAIGVLAALVGIRPKKSFAQHVGRLDGPMPEFQAMPHKIVQRNLDDEPLRLWYTGRFYVDLPEDRYTDSVCVDWVVAQEWGHLYVARCKVCPNLGEPWEEFPMKRADG